MHAYVVGRVWEAALKMLMFTLGNEGSRGFSNGIPLAAKAMQDTMWHAHLYVYRKGGRTLLARADALS